MKLTVKPSVLKYLVLGAGVLGFGLRALLYATGLDEQGLLARNHPASVLVTVLTAVVLAGVFWLTRELEGPEAYPDSFPASPMGCAGSIAAAAGILIATIAEMGTSPDYVMLLGRVLGFAAAASLVAIGVSRLMGTKPFFLLHVVLCLYFALRMVNQYRSWSSDPQLQDYCFQLLACVGLMLSSYQHAAFGADIGRHKGLWRLSLVTVFLCLVSAAGPENRLFFLTAGIWMFTDLSCLSPKPRRQRPELNLQEG